MHFDPRERQAPQHTPHPTGITGGTAKAPTGWSRQKRHVAERRVRTRSPDHNAPRPAPHQTMDQQPDRADSLGRKALVRRQDNGDRQPAFSYLASFHTSGSCAAAAYQAATRGCARTASQ